MDSLSIQALTFRDFRSYPSFHLEGITPLTIFVGPNAVGKTNIIEGIQLLTSHTSFRRPLMRQLIREGCQSAVISAEVVNDQRLLTLESRISDGKKLHTLNGKTKTAAELKGLLPSVVFTPDDLQLVKGSPSKRRRALDDIGSQLSANHYQITQDYEKVIQQKNRLLKEHPDPLLLQSYNEVIVRVGATLEVYRRALFARLQKVMADYYAAITQTSEVLSGVYRSSWEGESRTTQEFSKSEVEQKLSEALEQNLSEEIFRGRSLMGPHNDKIELYINNLSVGDFASQGQQRSVVLAWKLAEVQLIQEILHQQPVLLLDDVMSELDESRRTALITALAGEIQTFITTTNLAYFSDDLLEKAQVVYLDKKS